MLIITHNVTLTSGVTQGRLLDLLRHKYVDPGHFDPDTREQVVTSGVNNLQMGQGIRGKQNGISKILLNPS